MTLTGKAPKTELKTYGGPVERLTATDEFIQSNNLHLCRSQDEIRRRLDAACQEALDFSSEVYLQYLNFQSVKDILKEEAIAKYESGEDVWKVIDGITEAGKAEAK